ncbi:hypothetical protein Holit_01414 [Hollandina sp. SP2]
MLWGQRIRGTSLRSYILGITYTVGLAPKQQPEARGDLRFYYHGPTGAVNPWGRLRQALWVRRKAVVRCMSLRSYILGITYTVGLALK